MKVLLINQCEANKGDQTVLYSMLREFERNGVEKVWVAADEPGLDRIGDYRMGMDVEFVPYGSKFIDDSSRIDLFKRVKHRLNRFLLESALKRMEAGRADGVPVNPAFRAALREADMVVSTGGHHVTSLLVPNARSAQMFDIHMAVLSGKPTVLWSQSIGPLTFNDDGSRELVGRALKSVRKVFVREEPSFASALMMGVPDDRISLTHDSVFMVNDLFSEYVLPSKREKTVGIAVYHILRRSGEERENYIRSLAGLVDYAVEKGYTPQFVPMQCRGYGDDRPLMREICAAAKHGGECRIVEEDLQPSDNLRLIGSCRLFVGHKTHSVIMALAAGTPVLAISYHVKIEEFMREYGAGEFCVKDTDISTDVLIEKFDELEMDCDGIGIGLFEKSREYALKVRADLDSIFEAA